MWVRFALVMCVVLAASSIRTAHATQARQPASLRIAVIEGENAINIIEQKTAVTPIVEVRDRNDQPVAGAAVRFAIQRGRAAFGGARTLTMTTNAAGRATAQGFAATGSGAVQISASASFEGATASVTISQTTVATAAQLSSLTGAGGSTGGGAAGAVGAGAAAGGAAVATGGAAAGGVSVTTLAIVGGAVAGGTVVGIKVAEQGRDGQAGVEYAGPFSATETRLFTGCSISVAIEGTLTIHLITQTGNLNGQGQGVGTTTIIATNCGNTPPAGSSGPLSVPPAPVSGTPTAFTFTGSQAQAQPNGSLTEAFSFSGSLSGDTISGSLTHAYALTGQPATSSSSTMPVVLTKR